MRRLQTIMTVSAIFMAMVSCSDSTLEDIEDIQQIEFNQSIQFTGGEDEVDNGTGKDD